MGAWIEIVICGTTTGITGVAPLVGAWIEMFYTMGIRAEMAVAPLVGAWIEIIVLERHRKHGRSSLPSWERGLKSFYLLSCSEYLSRSPRGSGD